MTIIGRLVEWLRRREPRRDVGPRPLRKTSDRREPQPEVDQIEELLRFVGDTNEAAPRHHTKPTNARRPISKPKGSARGPR
jgi:hypothetical protein